MGSRILERLGYRVTVRTSSVEALELFRSKPDDFDLVITDMTMPNMTGDELAMELIAFRPDIPVILYRIQQKNISDEKAAKIGIKAFAYKPIVKAGTGENSSESVWMRLKARVAHNYPKTEYLPAHFVKDTRNTQNIFLENYCGTQPCSMLRFIIF